MTGQAKHAIMDLRLYLETPWPDTSAPLHKPGKNEILLFFKFYDPDAESLRYVGHLFAPKAARLKDLFPMLRKLAGLAPDTPLACYEEVKWEPSVMVVFISPSSLLWSNAQLETGDNIAFQVGDGPGSAQPPPAGKGAKAAAAAAAAAPRFPTATDFLSYVHNRLLVRRAAHAPAPCVRCKDFSSANP